MVYLDCQEELQDNLHYQAILKSERKEKLKIRAN